MRGGADGCCVFLLLCDAWKRLGSTATREQGEGQTLHRGPKAEVPPGVASDREDGGEKRGASCGTRAQSLRNRGEAETHRGRQMERQGVSTRGCTIDNGQTSTLLLSLPSLRLWMASPSLSPLCVVGVVRQDDRRGPMNSLQKRPRREIQKLRVHCNTSPTRHGRVRARGSVVSDCARRGTRSCPRHSSCCLCSGDAVTCPP